MNSHPTTMERQNLYTECSSHLHSGEMQAALLRTSWIDAPMIVRTALHPGNATHRRRGFRVVQRGAPKVQSNPDAGLQQTRCAGQNGVARASYALRVDR